MDREEALFPDCVPVKVEYQDADINDIDISDDELPPLEPIIEQEEPIEVPEVNKKTKINQKDIFIEPKLKIKPIVEPKELVVEKKKRKPMSEEHKAKLKLAREKANATRKANAVERKKHRELLKEEKDLEKQIKVKKVEKMKKEIETPEEVAEVKAPPKSQEYSQDQLQKAIADGIASYEIVRKKNKEIKKKKLEEEEHKKKIFNTIHKAVHNPEIDKWGVCFQ